MSNKNKLEHFAEMKTFSNVFEPEVKSILNDDYEMKGEWKKNYFKNDNSLVLELGCGKGEYTIGLAKAFPNQNFIGVDIKGARMWRGAKTALEENLNNTAFLRTRVEFIASFFGKNEVDEIWLTFSDPQPKKEKKRLSSPLFMKQYEQFLKPQGIIHLKTDSQLLYEYTLEQCVEMGYKILFQTNDLYGKGMDEFDEATQNILNIKTHYENLFTTKGFKINYLKFQINGADLSDLPLHQDLSHSRSEYSIPHRF